VAGRDDVVDAAACLVAASRIVRGVSMTLPTGAPECDARGLRMEIVV
jgi:predicted RNase H-like nuclease